jgi:hypothetical protein
LVQPRGPIGRRSARAELHLPRHAGASAVRRVAASAPEPAAPLKPAPRHLELIWRRPSEASSESVRRPREVAAPPPAQGHAVPAAVQKELDPGAPPGRAAVSQTVMKLDPALVDRLADDVIRRVERRVRIERERRGL